MILADSTWVIKVDPWWTFIVIKNSWDYRILNVYSIDFIAYALLLIIMKPSHMSVYDLNDWGSIHRQGWIL